MRQLKPSIKRSAKASRRTIAKKPALPWRGIARGTIRHGWPLAVLAGLAGGGYAARGWAEEQWLWLNDEAVTATTDLGFTLKDVTVEGRRETDRIAMLQALNVQYGDPILMLDVEKLQAQLETLPWIQHAAIERRLPDTLSIRIEERRVIAIWKDDRGQYYLVGDDGAVIPDADPARFGPLLLVAGNGAPQQVTQLQALLALEPLVGGRVKTALWVGERRWNLRFDNGVDLRLPEENLAQSWHQFATLEREQKILSRAITTIDMRLPDRVVVKTQPTPDEGTADKPKPTASNDT